MMLVAGVVLLAVIVLVSVFRYEYHREGLLRTDRWTGRMEVRCAGPGLGWVTPDIRAAAARTMIDPNTIQLDGMKPQQ